MPSSTILMGVDEAFFFLAAVGFFFGIASTSPCVWVGAVVSGAVAGGAADGDASGTAAGALPAIGDACRAGSLAGAAAGLAGWADVSAWSTDAAPSSAITVAMERWLRPMVRLLGFVINGQ
jgi:hypothetical protein